MKRGPKTGGADRYHTHAGDVRRVSPEFVDLARRRTEPFLDNIGMEKPIATLMQEAYFQGIKDAVAAMHPETVS